VEIVTPTSSKGIHMKEKKAKTLGVNMKAELAAEIEERADTMSISVSKYCKTVLGRWVKSGEKLKLEE